MNISTARIRFRRPAALVVSLSVALILAAGCGGTTSKGAGAAGGQPTYGSEEFGLTLEQLTVRIEKTEAAIGQCMSKAGFQFVPLDFASVKKAMNSDETAPGLSDEQYRAQYGLGVTTQFDKPIIVFGAGPQNQKILAALAPADQVAYRRTLWGEQPEWTLVRAIEQEDFSLTGGCTRVAAEQFFSATELSGSYINPADKLIASDPRMIAALKKWSDCMRKAGYNYDNPDAIPVDLRDRLAAIAQGQDPKTLTGSAQQALKALQGEELAIVRADAKCFDDHVDGVEAKVEADIYGARQN